MIKIFLREKMRKPAFASPREEILSNLNSSKLIGYDDQFREMRGKFCFFINLLTFSS